MFSKALLPESVTRQDGAGPEIAVEETSENLLVTLGITRILERQNLDVSIWGSADGKAWEPLAAFPRKSYCGRYSTVVNLTRHPGTRYLRAQWKMSRWDSENRKPLFGFYLHAEDVHLRHAGAA